MVSCTTHQWIRRNIVWLTSLGKSQNIPIISRTRRIGNIYVASSLEFLKCPPSLCVRSWGQSENDRSHMEISAESLLKCPGDKPISMYVHRNILVLNNWHLFVCQEGLFIYPHVGVSPERRDGSMETMNISSKDKGVCFYGHCMHEGITGNFDCTKSFCVHTITFLTFKTPVNVCLIFKSVLSGFKVSERMRKWV